MDAFRFKRYWKPIVTATAALALGAVVVRSGGELDQVAPSGGLTAALGGAGTQQVFGGRGAGNFLTKGTWILATTFFLTSVVLAYMSSSTDDSISKGSHRTHHSAPAPKKSAPAKK